MKRSPDDPRVKKRQGKRSEFEKDPPEHEVGKGMREVHVFEGGFELAAFFIDSSFLNLRQLKDVHLRERLCSFCNRSFARNAQVYRGICRCYANVFDMGELLKRVRKAARLSLGEVGACEFETRLFFELPANAYVHEFPFDWCVECTGRVALAARVGDAGVRGSARGEAARDLALYIARDQRFYLRFSRFVPL